MIELIIYDFLKNHDIPVYLEVQDDMPERFVIVQKTGGSETNHLKSARVAIQTYDKSMYKTAVFAKDIHDLMRDMIELNSIGSVRVNADPYNFTNSQTKQYRYQAVYDIVYY